ncbi:hypothetical protein B0T19DRAFT_17696 [Cercophora scortea]|uniref:2EXR domain-containing protein n=1 Tax=Cercophora scortea TaxID=314031 RepID=A0AAE0J3W3_9PEZI|nr:hypothetical protein B0T19DRAFT_17696 [Cercophora scortea]
MHYDHHFQHRCCSARMPDTFTNFQRLPAEIRTMIWEYSLPEPRVYEVLDAPNAKLKTPPHKGLMFANVHPEPPPALAAVCRESRYFVLHHYKPLTLGATTKSVDLSRDILLLEPYLLIKRLHRTLHFMSQIPLVRDNINRLALGTSYGIYTGICHPVLSWKVSKTNMGKMLSSLAKFTKLKTLIFIVHQEFQFEFDFRFPGTMTPIPRSHLPHSTSQSSLPPGHGPSSTATAATSLVGFPSPVSSHGGGLSGGPPPMTPPTTTTTIPRPMMGLGPSSTTAAAGLPSPVSSLNGSVASSTMISPSQPQASLAPPRPQLVHQAYRFKFDIEANINHTPRRPHLNELLYYPLDIDEDKDDWDLNDTGEESEWCDPWPTNDDWRRFRKRFQRAINLSLEMNMVEESEGKGAKGGAAKGKDARWDAREPGGRDVCARDWDWDREREAERDGAGGGGGAAKLAQRRMQVPALKGASLLWRYTRGGYV